MIIKESICAQRISNAVLHYWKYGGDRHHWRTCQPGGSQPDGNKEKADKQKAVSDIVALENAWICTSSTIIAIQPQIRDLNLSRSADTATAGRKL